MQRHWMARRLGAALMISTILGGTTGCALMDPYRGPVKSTSTIVDGVTTPSDYKYKTFSGENAEYTATRSDAQLLQDSRDLADSMALSYYRAARSHARTKTGLATGLLGLSTLTLFTAATRNINDGSDLAAANAVGGMGALALGGLLVSAPRQAVYQAGADAMICARSKTDGMVVATSDEPFLKVVPDAKTKNLAQALADIQPLVAAVADANAQRQPELQRLAAEGGVRTKQLDGAREEVTRARKALEAAEKTRDGALTALTKAKGAKAKAKAQTALNKASDRLSSARADDVYWTKNLNLMVAEQAGADFDNSGLTNENAAANAALADAAAEIQRSEPVLADVSKALAKRRASAFALQTGVLRIRVAVDRQVQVTEVSIEDIRKALGGMTLPAEFQPPAEPEEEPAVPESNGEARGSVGTARVTLTEVRELDRARRELAAIRAHTQQVVAPVIAEGGPESTCALAGVAGLAVQAPTTPLTAPGTLELTVTKGSKDQDLQPPTIKDNDAGLSAEAILTGPLSYRVRITATTAAKEGAHTLVLSTGSEAKYVPFEVKAASAPQTSQTETNAPPIPTWATVAHVKDVLGYKFNDNDKDYSKTLAAYLEEHKVPAPALPKPGDAKLSETYQKLIDEAWEAVKGDKAAKDKATPFELWWAEPARIQALQVKLSLPAEQQTKILDQATRTAWKTKGKTNKDELTRPAVDDFIR